MLVSWKWLNELVEIKKTPEEVATLLTMSGIEVERITFGQIDSVNLKVGLLNEITKHPQADKLVICRVEIGDGEERTIVTGASNVVVGQKVPVALPGAVLADGKKIEKAVLRGVMSEGMLCSAAELGMDVEKIPAEQKKGIYILPDTVSVGDNVVEVLNLDDVVLELELTPNRADCLGMLNIAREVAALTGSKLKLPLVKGSEEGHECAQMAHVNIEAEDLCKRYVARVIKDIQIAPSPLWLQLRLMAVGVRPINNVVDVTNYVMMEMGQPLHAFDYDCVQEKKIIVRKARANEELVTLDDQLRKLSPEMLIIADTEKPIAIAGVMGGLETEVTTQTKTILLEAAFFNGASVRRTSRALGLRSEASLRFEKGVDVEQVRLAADRAVQLLQEIGAGTPIEGCVDCYPVQEERRPIKLRIEKVNQVLGTALPLETMEEILKTLQIKVVEKNKEGWLFLPPSYRRDLVYEVDLIEEIARLYDYDKIQTTLPEGVTTQGRRTVEQKLRYKLRKIMVRQGLFEVLNYSFINPQQLGFLGIPKEHSWREVVTIQNPLSEEQGIMRTTLLPGLLSTVQRNVNNRNKNLKFFELGKVYFAHGFPAEKKLPTEKWMLAAVSTGKKEKSWAYEAEKYDFYYLKGVVENLMEGLGYTASDLVWEVVTDLPGFHPSRTVLIKFNGKKIGVLGEIHPLVLEKYEIEQRVAVLNIDVEKLWAEEVERKTFVAPLTKYPAVTRDLAIVVPEEVVAGAVNRLIKKQGGDWLQEVRLFDLYRGEQIQEGYKSLAFSLTWQAPHKTLTDEEVNNLHQKIEDALQKEFNADLRH
ncbi:MAG: phenylalanine--tRNA ligase subunit beta [Peptococcia bacterium]|jgi:phenylalanyl-tRNA synthetase beta chain